MIIKKLFSEIILLLFLFILSSPVQADSKTEELTKDIKIYLYTSHILRKQELNEFKNLLDKFLKQEKQLSLFKEIAFLVTNKIVRDRSNLQFLTMDLEKLAEDPYSAKIAKIKKNHFKSVLSKITQLIHQMRARRPKFNKPNTPLDKHDYKKIITTNAKFLIDGNIYRVYKDLEKKLDKAHSLWLNRYNQLLRKLKESGKEPEEIFNTSELKFLKVFGRIHIYYAKLKGEPLTK